MIDARNASRRLKPRPDFSVCSALALPSQCHREREVGESSERRMEMTHQTPALLNEHSAATAESDSRAGHPARLLGGSPLPSRLASRPYGSGKCSVHLVLPVLYLHLPSPKTVDFQVNLKAMLPRASRWAAHNRSGESLPATGPPAIARMLKGAASK